MRVVENAELLPALFAASPIGIAIASGDAHLLQVNAALCALLDAREDAILGTPLWQHIHPEHLPSCRAAVAALLQAEIPQCAITVRIRRQDGQGLWTQLTGVIAPAADNAPERLILYLQDLSPGPGAVEQRAFPLQDPQQILDRITDGFLALDRDWRITYVNKAAAPIFGLSIDALHALVGSNLLEVYPRTVESPAFAAAQTALRTGSSTSVEFYSFLRGAWLSVHVYPSDDGLSVLMRDITEARELEQALRDSEERYRFLLDHLPVVIYSEAPDSTQTTLYFSPRHEELSGYTLAEAQEIAGNWPELVHPDDLPRVIAESTRADAADDRFCAEYRLRRKDGQYIWIHDECVPARNDTGQIIAWQGVLLDITDRVKAQSAQAHLAALVASAEDAILSTDVKGAITSWNPGAEKLYGYRAEEMLGKSFSRLLHEQSEVASAMERGVAVLSGATIDPFESRRRRKDGTFIDVSTAMSPIRDEHGTIIGLSIISRDVSERKRLEQELRDALGEAQAAARTKTLFLAMMSHELRTPVQAVLGYAELLLLEHDGRLTPGQHVDVLSIRDGAQRLVRLIEHLLDLSRMEAGRFTLSSQSVTLPAVLETVRQDIQPLVEAKCLTLEMDVPASLPPVLGDPDRLRQILLNLVENAVKFTDHGTVSVRARETASGLAVEVHDTGIGIAEEAIPTIFEAFRQVDSTFTRRYGGAGLGLAIAQRLALHMGARISVSSAEGQGSTFTLEIPRAPAIRAAMNQC